MRREFWHWFCGNVTYPFWDARDGGIRIQEWKALLQSQFLSDQELRCLQLERLQHMVVHAFRHSDFYRGAWRKEPVIRTLADIKTLPVVRKSDVASNLDRVITDSVPRSELVSAKTGGSTGTSLIVYFDNPCQQRRNAAAMRSDSWAGWRPGSVTAALWGSPPVPKTPREFARNILHDRVFYLDTMRMDSDSMTSFVMQIARRRPEVIFGHAHSIFILATFIRDNGIRIPPVCGIVSTSMMLLEAERKVIEEVFRTRVSNRYGCEEVGLIASECERHDGMHVNAEHVLVEILDPDGNDAPPGSEGRIVVTDLINHGMPLIRYEVGDMAIAEDRPCACGRGLPMIRGLTGRTADYLKRTDGSYVSGISLVEKTLTAVNGVSQLQIVQEQLTSFVLNLVPGGDYSEASRAELTNAIKEAFGLKASVEIREMEHLPQERNSKYRFSICRI